MVLLQNGVVMLTRKGWNYVFATKSPWCRSLVGFDVHCPWLGDVHCPRIDDVHFPCIGDVHCPCIDDVHFPFLGDYLLS